MDWLSGMAEPRFLVLYWVAVVLAVLVAVLGPASLPRPRPVRRPGEDDLDPYELAMIAGGSRRVVDTALAGLLDAGAARITGKGTVVPGEASPRDRVQRSRAGPDLPQPPAHRGRG